MTEASHEQSHLPEVTEFDLLDVSFEEKGDPTHNERWLHFARGNRVLARELLDRAGQQLLDAKTYEERVQAAVNLVTYAARALELAMKRASDGVDDDANLQP